LGLAITKHLVEILGGTISLKSTLGQGSSFMVKIPIDAHEYSSGQVSARADIRCFVFDHHRQRAEILMGNLRDVGAHQVGHITKIPRQYWQNNDEEKYFFIHDHDLIALDDDNFEFLKNIALRSDTTCIIIQTDPDIPKRLPHSLMVKTLPYLYQVKELIRVFRVGHMGDVKHVPIVEHISKGYQILLVEDDTVNRLIATEALKNGGYNVHIARDGLEAVELTRQHKFDLILMDCMMPNMDGYQATNLIRTVHNLNHATNIIALTASALQADRDKCLQAGMNDYLSKPFRQRDLLDLINRYLN
jgi:CheY-like chemotaxis protein